jgi:hypothetical protein
LETGYSSSTPERLFCLAIARRQEIYGGIKKGYVTILPLLQGVEYQIFADVFKGGVAEWHAPDVQGQTALRIDMFDNSLYVKDLTCRD